MNSSQKLLTSFKASLDLPSNYKAALVLGISKQSVSKVAAGKNHFSDETIIKIAELMEIDPIELVAERHIQGESVPQRLFWQEILDRSKVAQSLTLLGLQANKVA